MLPTQALSRFAISRKALLTLRVMTWSSLNRITCGPNSGEFGYEMHGHGRIATGRAEGRFKARIGYRSEGSNLSRIRLRKKAVRRCGSANVLPTQALSRLATTRRALLTLRVGTWSSLNRIACGPNSGEFGYGMDGHGEIASGRAEGRFRA